MMERLEHAELQTITIPNHSVHWYKKGKEIVVHSTLFDVHRYTIKKDSTIFIGLFDTKETELKNQVAKLMTEDDPNSSSRDLIIAKLMFQLWIVNSDNDFEFGGFISIHTKHVFNTDKLLSPAIRCHLPPPKANSYIVS